MDAELDHYVILGLPTGEEGAKLSEEEIKKAYKSKILELHPDKRPDDPNAHHDFINLHTSYTILMDKKARQIFHHQLLEAKKKIKRRKSQQQNSKRRKTDLDEREQAVGAAHSAAKAARDKEEWIGRRNEQLIAEIKRVAAASKAPPAASTLNKGAKEASTGAKEASTGAKEASTQCPPCGCQGDWLDKEFSSNFGGRGFEEYQNSVLTKFRKKDKNDIPKHQDL